MGYVGPTRSASFRTDVNNVLTRFADLSTAAAQDQLRGLLWDDLITYLREKRHGQPVIEELERLRMA
jgi:hypothetical protein